MKIRNTSKSPKPEWLFGGNPNAIESQEADGQRELKNSSQLPATVNSPRDIIRASDQYQKMGVEVIGASDGDEMFLDVRLPAGWKIQTTEHSMWSNMLDDKGRKRASIFYKAAFYDRSAHIDFCHRYYQTFVYTGELKQDGKTLYPKKYCVKDASNEDILFETEVVTTEYQSEELKQQCIDFLKEKFPQYEDLNAYWD